MPLVINLDVILARRKMRSNDLARLIGITPQNLSVLQAGRARAIRFSTLEAICRALNCQPGDILEYQPDTQDKPESIPPLSPPPNPINDSVSKDQSASSHPSQTGE